MFERGIGHRYDQLIRRLAISFNNNGPIFALGRVEQRPQPLERKFLVAKINRRDRATSDADDLLILLRTKQKGRSRRRNRDPRLQNKVRAQEQEKNEQKDYIN